MKIILDYFIFVVNKIITILDTLRFPGSSSILYYFLGAIIIGFIIKLVKGGSSEFEASTNFLNSRIISTGVSNYKQNNYNRKAQIVYQKGFTHGMVSMTSDEEDYIYNHYLQGKKEAGL